MDDLPTPPITRDGQSVVGIHERLRAAILNGEIGDGETTTQAKLAVRFDVGRTPLREALRMLQREGLINSEPNRRVRIAALTSDDAEELYIMRISLEAVAIRITVPTLTSADFAEIEGFMAQMEHYMKSEDHSGHRGPHRLFHRKLVAGAGPRVAAMIEELSDHADRYRQRFGALGEADQRRAEHREIIQAAAAGDQDLAARLLVGHYLHTVRLVFEELGPDHDLTRLRQAVLTVAPGAAEDLDGPRQRSRRARARR